MPHDRRLYDEAAQLTDYVWQNLRHLMTDAERLTDAGLPWLARFPRLSQLALYDTAVTPAGLASLPRLPWLRLLYVEEDRIGERVTARLHKMLPGVNIF